MFRQQHYINSYIKENYKSIKLRIKKDDLIILEKLKNVPNVNQYLLDLIRKDINENRKYNFINNNVTIDFELTNTMKNLIYKAGESDFLNDYGLYMNYVYAIDSQAKKEVTRHIISESNWQKLLKRYPL